jgi:hypothetical protein
VGKDAHIAPWENQVVARVTIKDLAGLYAQKIKTAIFNAITVAMGNARAEIEHYIHQHFPRKTGDYQADVIGTVKLHATEENPWLVEVGAQDTTYAMFVNAMRGVNWTNTNTYEDAQSFLKMFVQQQVRQLVRRAVIDAVNYYTYQTQVSVKNA